METSTTPTMDDEWGGAAATPTATNEPPLNSTTMDEPSSAISLVTDKSYMVKFNMSLCTRQTGAKVSLNASKFTAEFKQVAQQDTAKTGGNVSIALTIMDISKTEAVAPSAAGAA